MNSCGYQTVAFAGEIVGVEWAGDNARRAIIGATPAYRAQ